MNKTWLCMAIADEKKKKRKGAGGTWRAFQKVHGSGSSGLPNNAKVAAAYHSLKQAASTKLDSLQVLGQSVTAAAKLQGLSRNALLSTAKTAMRRRKQIAIRTLWGNMKGRSTRDVAAAILGETKRIGRGVDNALSWAAAFKRYSAEDRKAIAQKRVQVLQQWQNTQGQEHLQQFYQLYPNMQECALVP
eukprot:514702-Amphidinium_carterae.3